MLILCIGPDTFRAQAKARELEAAFREKYDASGNSIEHLSNGKDAADEVIERANTVSLFSPRRFMRTVGLLSDCPKAKQAALVQALSKDPENVIVVDVEEDALTASAMKVFEKTEKIIKYDFPAQSGRAFQTWLWGIAKTMQVTDEKAVQSIAIQTDSDSWLAWNELSKIAAGGRSEYASIAPSPTIYDFADAYLREDVRWRKLFLDEELMAQSLSAFLSQARSAARVKDGFSEGLHPYVARKLQGKSFPHLEVSLAKTIMSLLSQRTGLGVDDEVSLLFS